MFLLKKGYKTIITTRNVKLAKKKIPFKNKNLVLTKLNVLKKKEIKKLILQHSPKLIFYFASQSSPKLSFEKNRSFVKKRSWEKIYLQKKYKQKIKKSIRSM